MNQLSNQKGGPDERPGHPESGLVHTHPKCEFTDLHAVGQEHGALDKWDHATRLVAPGS
jgi:hypothetical protein